MLRLAPVWLACAALFASGPATGQTPEPSSSGPVLHEYVPDEKDLQALIDFAKQTGAGKLPPGFRQDGDLLKRPKDGLTPRPREKKIGDTDRQTQRQKQAAPDRETKHEGQLHYQAVFNPSVVPFKRVSALDGVNSRFVLVNRDPVYRTVGLTKVQQAPDRAYFWGSVLLRARRHSKLPLPSVAPDMQIHGYETLPRGIGVTFYRDGAGNFAVAPSRSRPSVRLRFLVSAPNRYFSHEIPAGLSLDDVPKARRPVVPAAVARVAERMHRRLGIDRSQTFGNVLNKLVAHFRAFEEGPLAVNTGNTYEDLTVSQRGVCRHRSYAFVITALSIGLPARYLTNEAHAFVEVWVPRTGWIRIDLGGAANELNVSGAKGRAVHRPLDDPFPKPPQYSQNYSRLNGAVTGLSPGQRQGPQPRTGHGARRRFDPSGKPIPGPSGSPAVSQPRPPGVAVRLAVAGADTTGLRGDPLTITGTVTNAQGEPLAGRPVELLLRRPGNKDLIILGETVSNARGGFTLVTTIPLAAGVGTHRVVAFSAADKTHQAGWSE
ncbi:MAG: transglutaminase domain-containing protein [bacterium]